MTVDPEPGTPEYDAQTDAFFAAIGADRSRAMSKAFDPDSPASVLNHALGTELAFTPTIVQAGESLPVRVTATMWVDAKGRTPDVALCGLRREIDRWRTEEGWELADGSVSVAQWDGSYQAECCLTRAVNW